MSNYFQISAFLLCNRKQNKKIIVNFLDLNQIIWKARKLVYYFKKQNNAEEHQGV